MAGQACSAITVDAPRAAVLDVIADFPAYPEWATYLKSAEVVEPGPDGRARRVRFRLDAGVIADDYELAYDWSGDDGVCWRLVSGGVLTAMDGSYALVDGGGSTEVTYRLAVDVSIPVLGLIKRKAEKVIIDTALKELKKRVEG